MEEKDVRVTLDGKHMSRLTTVLMHTGLTSETVSGLRPEHRNHSGSGSVAFPRAVLQNELDQTQVPALVAEQRKGIFPFPRIVCLVFCVGVKSICQVHCGAGHVLLRQLEFRCTLYYSRDQFAAFF